MVNHRFIPQQLVGREAQQQQISQILSQDGDFFVVGVAAQKVGARVLEIDCLRTTSASRFLHLLADGILEVFANAAELSFIQRWSTDKPLVFEQFPSQRPRLVWHQPSSQEWAILQVLLALPQLMAEWLDCRVVIVFLNFPHVRSWDRSGQWEDYLQQEIQHQSRVSYALVSTVVEPWVQQSNLQSIALAPLESERMKAWIVPAMATEGLRFDEKSQALNLFLENVQGHLGSAIALARRIWLDRCAFSSHLVNWEKNFPASQPLQDFLVASNSLIEAHHVHGCTLALVEDLSITFESLILLLPPSQVRVLESLALDPTDKPQAGEYIQKHQLTRGGGLQGALASLEQKGLLYGAQHNYRIALPFLAFWLRQRLN
jgi:hypothetical protein